MLHMEKRDGGQDKRGFLQRGKDRVTGNEQRPRAVRDIANEELHKEWANRLHSDNPMSDAEKEQRKAALPPYTEKEMRRAARYTRRHTNGMAG
jgi:hypothetical protein